MGLETRLIEVSEETRLKIKKAQLRAKDLRERCEGETFSEILTEEDEEYMQKFRSNLKKRIL